MTLSGMAIHLPAPMYRDMKATQFHAAIRLCATIALVALAAPAPGQTAMTEDFTTAPETRWDYVADTVMGGVSEGGAVFETQGGVKFIHLTGTVSTRNNGGFIQVRTRLSDRLPADASTVTLQVRGNTEPYFVHLRTRGSVVPWHYYQAEFPTTPDWQTVRIPLTAFQPSSNTLPARIDPETIISIGIVAFGRDHVADVSVARIAIE
jgi:hypothetical protein